MRRGNVLLEIYDRLYRFYGPQHWWPGDTRLEIIVGAILTQNTSWSNVEKAIGNLKKAGVLSLVKIRRMNIGRLARLIRPSGYYNVKSRRLKEILAFLSSEYGKNFKKAYYRRTEELKTDLMNIKGIGPETCDSILLYAFNRPVFVVDAYTKRIFSRHNFFGENTDYHDVQRLFMSRFPRDRRFYNEYHALIVRLGKEFCRKRPDCGNCPIKDLKIK